MSVHFLEPAPETVLPTQLEPLVDAGSAGDLVLTEAEREEWREAQIEGSTVFNPGYRQQFCRYLRLSRVARALAIAERCAREEGDEPVARAIQPMMLKVAGLLLGPG